MAKRFLLALVALLCASAAQAQTFPKPPDVPAFVDRTTGILYAAGTTLNVPGDGSNSWGGTPPAMAYELPDIPTTESGWDRTTDNLDSANFKLLAMHGGTGSEIKFRTHANFTHVLFDDPIRNYGQPGTSHCHIFFGNGSVNAYSTYASLRATGRKYSRAAGGPKNSTGYWMPCILIENAFGDGKTYVVKPNVVAIYYVQQAVQWGKIVRPPLGLRYVGGYNMDDGTAWLQGKVDEANAQPGTSGRYSVANGGFKAGDHRFLCESTGQTVHYLRAADGSDPFSPTCPSSSRIILQFDAPNCWDGVNMWSPGGYKHVIPQVYDSVASDFICPNGWYRIPSLHLSIALGHEGATGPRGYMNWKLASDPITGNANSGTINGETVLRGETFHNDWFNGWDLATLLNWNRQCIGTEGNIPHECNYSVTGRFQRLILDEATPTGRSPAVEDNDFVTDDPDNMFLVPSSPTGTHGDHDVTVGG